MENGYTSLKQIAGILMDIHNSHRIVMFWRWGDAEEGEEGKARSDLLHMRQEGRSSKIQIKKMISCPDPENCVGNFRTAWHSSEDAAIVEWNTLIRSFRA